MKKIILVPMKRDDRVEDLLPYVEEVARPGMKVMFMAPYPVDGFRWSHHESGRRAIEEGMALANYYKWDNNLRKARERFAPAMDALAGKGIGAEVGLYAGNIRRAVREYATKGAVHLIVTRAGIGQRFAGLFGGFNSWFGVLKRPSISPVWLIQPGAVA